MSVRFHPLSTIIVLIMAMIMAFVANSLIPIMWFSAFLALYLVVQGFYKTTFYMILTFVIFYALYAVGESMDLPQSISMFLIFPYFGLRLMPIYMAAVPLLRKISPSEMLQFFEKMHFSRRISLPVVVCMRYTPTLLNEYKTIRQYVKQRLMGRPFWEKWEYLMIPFLFRSIKISEELSVSATLRGIELNNTRTNAEQLHFKWFDKTVSILAVILGIALEVGL
ncbi:MULTISPECIES: energy-coupling factor transporter transmembrane component T family protein [Brochothrix]|uniref:Energy-coupling factor transporter transmembrane protein EcfT n=1 Tax=Brochothrix thermosphacta TaxID=2756 RepID=A0A1D2LPL0_BROTH|nr:MULTISPECIES: energy-coupling factor transporter transmembrane component T [Brochothrix]SLN02228.1 Transmembrane component BL0694 of energizing module of predicted ECF transporter [Brachybacterium faecium]ANZ95675.1 hypothetical protein BFC19_09940 [Brochothrix thermosphacta]ANZ98282.1 hypothetical protein BFC20_11495 [Brochothrix thermosphacta]ATF25479.1 energy-coupling factor transporter transmembrane protein EcfT [Brochothrix thermosphacta]ATH84811.1 energy-coupling factor transporter tr